MNFFLNAEEKAIIYIFLYFLFQTIIIKITAKLNTFQYITFSLAF